MTLPLPDFVRVAGIRDASIRFRWDDWNVEAVDMPLEPILQERLHAISQRAVAAFTISAAEWVIHRFSTLMSDVLPRQYLEAAWAQVIDPHYATHHDINPDDWRGPVRSPVGTAIRRVKFAVQQADLEGEPAWRAGRLSRLAEHVLPVPDAFLRWRDRVIDRLIALYPFDPEDTLGDVVPWQFLDPDKPAQSDDTERLINEFLQSLDPQGNPFLNSPGVMTVTGFKGRPYVFSLAEDRRRRFEW